MKKPTFFKIGVVLIILVFSLQSYAQNFVPFTPRFNQDLKGDIRLIGNNILGPSNDPFNNNSVYNHNVDMQYIDIDGDPSTFNSTSADLEIPNPGCYRIIHAGLYWGAVTNGADPITNVKFKGPTGGYNDITGTVIYDAGGVIVAGNSFPYSCYADVTSIVTGLANNLGTYTIGNISTARGETGDFDPSNNTGYSAGWSLYIVYEDPTLPGKSITSFDGFSAISLADNPNLDIPVSGFRTVPVPLPVRANFAFAALEGDSPIVGDQLLINGVNMSTADRLANNFFDSSVTQLSALPVDNRNPNSTNTLGFDTGVMAVPNPGNSVISNDTNNATISLNTAGDTYFVYFTALAVDIIEPNIVLTKIVLDEFGVNIGGQVVELGQPLTYVIGFQNTGNDDTGSLIIRDVLPINIIFDYPTGLELPPGVTVVSYDPITREIIFSVDNSYVEEGDPVSEIRINVTVVDTCNEIDDACSNIINNQAFATYTGITNPNYEITDDPSVNSNTGCLLTPQATNFLADLNDCIFEQNEVLCGDSVDLTAADGYDTYSWSTSPTGTPVIGTTQTITVTNTGTYYVQNTAIAPCQSIDQVFVVTLYGTSITNPVIPFADEVVTCPNDGKLLPNIFLCGANDFVLIETNITDASSIIWEQLDESSCPPVTDSDCANENGSCIWNQVGTGPDFLVNTAGQFRLTLNYDGGCFNQFYFNVYQNILDPTVISQDIICDTPGQITVGGVPTGYEYSIDGVNYQMSNIFPVSVAGLYTVSIRQIGIITNPCIFTVPDIQIRERDFTVSTNVIQPYCNGDKGSISAAANDVRPQYFFSIYIGGTLINSVGPIIENNYTFDNLNPGTYTINVETEDGCTYTEDIIIVEPPLLTATSALTIPLTCADGEITVYADGGTPPYFYFVNSTTVFQTVPEIVVNAPGVFDITVVDSNNCSASTAITVEAIPAPEFNISTTDITCANSDNSGAITVNVTDTYGSTLEFSIDGGVTFFNSPVFTGLAEGDYEVIVQYTLGSSVCETNPQIITINANEPIQGIATLTAPYTCTTNGVITIADVSGGVPPYMYSIDGVTFQSSNMFSDLTNGTYTVIISDANNCTLLTNEINIDALNPPTDLTFSNTPLSCPLLTSTVTITGTTGGIGILQYQITSPASAVTPYQTSTSFPDLEPNTYTFQVMDANECVYSESYTIAPLPTLTVALVLTEGLDCTVTPDAIITGTITGGSGPFTHAVSINGGAYSSLGVVSSPFTYTTPTEGTYQFQIIDANGCIAESAVQTINAISFPDILSVIQTEPILCNGDSNAAIDITINNTVGIPIFTLNINNDTTGTNYGTQTSGLPAGSYTITLTDGNSCTDTESITITEPDPIDVIFHTVDITCTLSGVSQGSIIIDGVTGGVGPYNYLVSGTNGYSAAEINTTGGTSVSFDVVDFGLYQINVVDFNGCSVLMQDVLVASPPTDLDIVITASVDCLTGGEAVVSVGSSLSSSGPFFFSVYQGPISVYPNPVGSWLPEDTAGSQSATFTGLTPGITYTFIVYDDSTGCSYYEPATSPIPTNSTLTTNALTANNVTCTGSADGNVSFTINSTYGVSTNVNYEIFDSLSLVTTGISGSGIVPASSTLSIIDLGPLPVGNYYILINETSGPNTGCGIVTVPFNITESAIELIVSATVNQNANCNSNSGVISAVAMNGTAPYMYQINTSAIPPLATDSSWTSASTFNMDANSYYVHAMDAYGCIRSTPIVVLPNDPVPIVSATLSDQCSTNEGEFEIEVILSASGIPPHSYSINNGAFQVQAAPFTISNLASGTHTIEVNDANGCGNLISLDIASPIALIPEVTTSPTCNDDDGEITIIGSGGNGSYTYSINPNPTSITLAGNIFSGVPSGTYVLTITDSNLCSEDVTITLATAIAPSFTTLPSAVTCFGDSNGTFEIEVNGYSGPYSYEVFDSSSNSVFGVLSANTSINPEIVSGMSAGIFNVVITETASPFCSATSNVIIPSPAEALSVVAIETSNVTCDDNAGTITATASGGWGTYEYELTGDAIIAFSSVGTFEGLSAGNYTVNVMDAGGCIASENVTLLVPPPINAVINTNTSVLDCFGDTDAVITVSSVTGGSGSDYSYTLNMLLPTPTSSGPQTSPIFGGLGAGTYNVIVSDPLNCSFASADIIITEPTPIEAILIKATTQSCLTQATLTLSATGGTGLYIYSDNSTMTPILGAFASSITFPVAEGTYNYYVSDANGCLANVSNDIVIDPLPDLTINLSLINAVINCAGDNTGVIIANAEGGLGNYEYTLQDASGNPIPANEISPGVFTELIAGTYQVEVVSDDCISTSALIDITEPVAPLIAPFTVTDVTCNGANDGVLEINASGGTGIIKYAISPQMDQFFETNIFENLEPGSYDVIVQDELGCYLTFSFTISEPSPVIINIVSSSIFPEVCEGDNDGEFSITVSGGTPPYEVSLDDYDGVYTTGEFGQTQFDFTGLRGGDHTVFVRDNFGCESEWNITFPESVSISPIVEVEYSCVNNLASNIVTVAVDEGITNLADLDYSLNGGPYQSSNVFTDVVSGIGHYIDVRHTNGCIQTTELFDITTFDPLILAIDDGELNEIIALVTGGSGDYQFTLNGEDYGDTNIFTIDESGEYTLVVTDSNGCIAVASRFFEFVDICIPNYFTPNGDSVMDEWGPECSEQYEYLEFSIFDRYGRKVATLPQGQKWDGRYNEAELPTGDYWYVINLNDPSDDRDFVGHFTLYR